MQELKRSVNDMQAANQRRQSERENCKNKTRECKKSAKRVQAEREKSAERVNSGTVS